MAILNSIQKERLLWQVQQQGYSIRIEEVAKLIVKYENLMVEDFAPPVLSSELYERLKDMFAEEAFFEAIRSDSEEGLSEYLRLYPNGLHADEALFRLNHLKQVKRESQVRPISFSSSPVFRGSDKDLTSEEECEAKGAVVGNRLPMILGGPIGAIISGIIESWSSSRVKKKNKISEDVYCSIFAPAEVKLKSRMLVQVYIHLFEETEKVKSLAQESDKDAERRDYIPLQCKLKKGDKVDVQLNIYGKTLLMSEKKRVLWQGSFTKCSFDFVPKDNDMDVLSCVALLSVNGIPVGEMRFITKIVESPRKLNPEIISHQFNKVFISYAHKDEEKVKSFHEGLKLAGIEHFFDRAYLKAGDIFPLVIQDYINTADLFVLFWSENALKSEYVDKERKQALERAFPQVKPQQAAKLSIYPMSIEPRAELPEDMKDNYHFGEI